MTTVSYSLYALSDPREPMNIRYVGITSRTIITRLSEHLSEAKAGSKNHRCCWIRKLLAEGIQPKIELLDSLPTWEAVCEAEKETIKLLKEMGHKLVNATDGGEGTLGYRHSEETRKKISAAKKGVLGYRHSDETRKKIGAANKGMLGHKHSDETRKKMSAAKKGKRLSLEQRAKMSEVRKGIPKSAEHRAKLSEVRKGIPISAEHRAKLSAFWKGTKQSVEQIEKKSKPIIDHNNTIYKSIREAARLLGLQPQNIIKVLKGKNKQTGGFTFQYL